MYRIEPLLSARLFLEPQISGDYIYFVSNLSGKLSLYRMRTAGSVPEPLLPPDIAVQNPHHLPGLFEILPKMGKILIILDNNGDENYKPMLIPLEGGYPEPLLKENTDDYRFFPGPIYPGQDIFYLFASAHNAPVNISYRCDLASGTLEKLWESMYGGFVDAVSEDHNRMVIIEGYSSGDNVAFLLDRTTGERTLLYGKPLEDRAAGETVEFSSIGNGEFVRGETGLVFYTTLFEDAGGLGYLDLAEPQKLTQVPITGAVHTGRGEFLGLRKLTGNRYLANYNIDGCDWVYEGVLDEQALEFRLEQALIGTGGLANGVLEHLHVVHDDENKILPLVFSTATSPTQIYTLERGSAPRLNRLTNERLLGIPDGLLSAGEDYPFTSHDGLEISARLYLPPATLGFNGPRPIVYYIHGGPQGQERPDFTWFSMPLIQYLTLNGMAVFVPNVRGSTGYGMAYMKEVDNDWGGKDRLDHVFALTQVLAKDPRLDAKRAAVTGRSYGGYMTLTLAARHPELWSAACDMFGPYNLFTFIDRLPETWKPYFYLTVGHPDRDKDFLTERSPRTYIEQIACPMLVIQGKNDPRVIEQESRDLVDYLRSLGKDVEYLMFENEGHDVLRYENRATCYTTMAAFFAKHLQP